MLVVVLGSLAQLREGWVGVPGHTPVPKGNGAGAVHASQEDKRFRYCILGGASFHLGWSLPRAKVPPSVLGSIRWGGTLGDTALVAGQTSHPSEYIAISINPLRWKGDRWFTPLVPDGPGPGGRQSTWGPHKAVFVSPLYLGTLGPCWF